MKKTVIFLLILVVGLSLLPLGVVATNSELPYVYDGVGLLSELQLIRLENRAKSLSETYQCDLRIIIVSDMREYGYRDILDLANDLYTSYNLGYGLEKNCVLLTLSMNNRDYDFAVWGTRAENAFTLYGIDNILDKHILPKLADDDYYSAFGAFFNRAEEYFDMALNGRPFDTRTDRSNVGRKILVSIVISIIVSFLLCSVWRSKMKTASIAKTAHNYIPAGGFMLTGQMDQFLYRTTTRTRIQSNTSSGSGRATSGRSGGSSGRSGRF
ncbi:MAG: TPM domain-containing protein [Oscillospiraceae bacterium]|nr:TPM domain-containing protein [Oscillospiraceae bacterium]